MMKRGQPWAFCMLTVPWAMVTANVDAKTLYVNAGDGTPVAAALREGDITALQNMVTGTTDPAIRSAIQAALDRMQGHYASSIKTAEGCYDSALKLGKANIALVCARVWAGNYFIQGDLARWSQTVLKTWDAIKPLVAKQTGVSDISLHELDFARALSGVSWPSVSVSGTQKTPLPFTMEAMGNSDYFGPIPRLQVTIGTKVLQMTVDTGSYFSVLSEADTSSQRVVPLHVKVPVRTTVEESPGTNRSDMQLGYIKQLTIGSVTLKNLPVLIGGNGRSVLGLEALSKLGRSVTLSRRALMVDKKNETCTSPMITASDLSGTIGKTFGLLHKINGSTSYVALDTGNNVYMEGYSGTSSFVTSTTPLEMSASTISEKRSVSYYPAKVSIGYGNSAMDARAVVSTDVKPSFKWTFGSAVLRDFDIYLDFVGQKACLTPVRAHS